MSVPADAVAVPRALPRGPHALPRDVVLLSQRRRLLEGMVEACAIRGYPETSVKDVLAIVGVSRQTFYEHFTNKQDCFLAAFREGAEGHYRRVRRAVGESDGWLDGVQTIVRTYLAVLESEPALARTFLVESAAAGPRAAELHDEFRERYVDLIAEIQGRLLRQHPETARVPREILRAATAAVDALVVDRLKTVGPDAITDLEPFGRYLVLSALGVPDAFIIAGLAPADRSDGAT